MASRRPYPNPPYPVTPPADPDPSESPFSPKNDVVQPIKSSNNQSLPPPLPPKLPTGNTSAAAAAAATTGTPPPSNTSPHYYSHYQAQEQAQQQQQQLAGRTSAASPPPPPKNPSRPAYAKRPSPPLPPRPSAEGVAPGTGVAGSGAPTQAKQNGTGRRFSFEEERKSNEVSRKPLPPKPAGATAAPPPNSSNGNVAIELPSKPPDGRQQPPRTEEEYEARKKKRKDSRVHRDKISDTDRRRRQVNSKRTRLRLLALDGGGIRGYSTLLLLESLMHDVFVELHGRAPKRGEEVTKPCEVFDLICGTGTGGLIAIMLGRLRMSVQTCKEVYVRMTRYVFETDKRVIGIPYGDTLFKASKLERAIKEVVRERSRDDSVDIPDEFGSDEEDWDLEPRGGYYDDEKDLEGKLNRLESGGARGSTDTRTDSIRGLADASRLPSLEGRRAVGNENALMHDKRKGRCKTFVTAVYKGSNKDSTPAYLRTYSSGVESMSYPDCKIWQAGRATAATLAAFKEIKIAQDVFLDEGNGKYNPTPQILEEALVNEWPGRDLGCIISLGTGKRPPTGQRGDNKVQWWENLSSSLDVFTQARRRLMAKIDACEDIHQSLIKEGLARYNVSTSRYFRFNVDSGVGEVAMNEWSRLSEVSTATRVYLANRDVDDSMKVAARKLGKITLTKQRKRMEKDMEKLGFESNGSSRPSTGNGPVFEMPAESVVTEPIIPEGMVEMPATPLLKQQQSQQQQQQQQQPVMQLPAVPNIRITPPTVKYAQGRPSRDEGPGQAELPG